MSEVKRYTMGCKGLPFIDEEGVYVLHADYAALQQKLDALEAKTKTPSLLKVELPEVEKWRSMDQVRAQMAYRVLVEKAINTTAPAEEKK